MFLVLKLLNI